MTSDQTNSASVHQNEQQPPYEWSASCTLTGAVSQMTLASVSTLSSALILYIIFKSSVKVKSTFHRIMAILSTSQLFLSFGVALGTIPIPESSVPYKTPTLGSASTCFVQGLMLEVTTCVMMDATLCLAWYYVCKVLRLSNWIITRVYEPVFYTYMIANSAVKLYKMLTNNWISIDPRYAQCIVSPIPISCYLGNATSIVGDEQIIDADCQWPTDPEEPIIRYISVSVYFCLMEFFLIVVAMLLIIWLVYYKNESESNRDVDVEDGAEGNADDIQFLEEEKHQILRQACLFVLACFATWFFFFFHSDGTPYGRVSDALQTIMNPLGGFWDMLIFVHIKIRSVRETNHDIKSNFEAFMLVIKKPDAVPDMVFSGIENVNIEREDCFPASIIDGDDEEEQCSKSLVEEASSYFTSHPSAYDDLLSESRTPSVETSNFTVMTSLSSLMAALRSGDEEKLRRFRNIPSYGAINNNRTVRFAVDDEDAIQGRHTRRAMRLR